MTAATDLGTVTAIATVDVRDRRITAIEEGTETETPTHRAGDTVIESVRTATLDVMDVTDVTDVIDAAANASGIVTDVATPAATTTGRLDGIGTHTMTVDVEEGTGATMDSRDKNLAGAHRRHRRSENPLPT